MMVNPETVKLAQQGDREALGEIIERTYHYVKGFLVRRASNYDYADEATAETYLAMLESIRAYEDRGRIEQWLCGIGRNQLSHIERRETYRAHPRVGRGMAARTSTEGEALERARTAELRRVLSALTPMQRTALDLRFLIGLDMEETAALMQTTRARVKYATFHGLERLRQRQLFGG